MQADSLIACDGVASALRQQMLGDEKRYAGLTAILGAAPTGAPEFFAAQGVVRCDDDQKSLAHQEP